MAVARSAWSRRAAAPPRWSNPGHVRINGGRQTSPGHAIKIGDVVTIALDRGVRVLKVIGSRRPPAAMRPRLLDSAPISGRP
ncbi:MAG: RNA-binding S4 domain-containing protein [Rhodopseudomonas palustris]|nr:RNA-binding S4 domain-containing protein [Rhodopseudomonas palustris]